MLQLASVTDSLATLATHIINDLGLAGVGLMCATTGVVGIPGTEPTMLFAGFNVYQHHLTLVGIVAAGVLGDVIGATIAYAIGYYGRIELIERLPLDARRSVALIRRDGREHLILVGPEGSVVLEAGIVPDARDAEAAERRAGAQAAAAAKAEEDAAAMRQSFAALVEKASGKLRRHHA